MTTRRGTRQAEHRRYYQRIQDRIANDPEFAAEYRAKQRELHLKKTYGITSADYDRLLAAQGGRCAACDTSSSPDNPQGFLHVDHDHLTGEVRGLLCKGCNQALGMVRDDVDRLMSLASYLLQRENVLETAVLTGKGK